MREEAVRAKGNRPFPTGGKGGNKDERLTAVAKYMALGKQIRRSETNPELAKTILGLIKVLLNADESGSMNAVTDLQTSGPCDMGPYPPEAMMSIQGQIRAEEQLGSELGQYAGKWVAVHDHKVIAAKDKLGPLVDGLNGHRETAEIFQVPRGPSGPC